MGPSHGTVIHLLKIIDKNEKISRKENMNQEQKKSKIKTKTTHK